MIPALSRGINLSDHAVEINDLTGRLLGEALPAVHLAHRDLARSQQGPEQYPAVCIVPGAFSMRVYGPHDIADERGDREGRGALSCQAQPAISSRTSRVALSSCRSRRSHCQRRRQNVPKGGERCAANGTRLLRIATDSFVGKPIRERDAGNRHGRFDERGRDTGCWLIGPKPTRSSSLSLRLTQGAPARCLLRLGNP
jgi:hypothetical protein